MNKELKTSLLKLPIIIESEGSFDISQLDFSSLGIKVLKMMSPEFMEFITQNSFEHEGKKAFSYNFRSFQSLNEELHNTTSFVSIPLDAITKQEDYAELNYQLQLPYHILQILSPSKIQIKEQVHFDVSDMNELNSSSATVYNFKSTFSYPNKNINIPNIEGANKLIEKYSRLKDTTPFKVASESYLTCFEINFYHMQFLSLIMTMESIVQGSQELSYRLKRGIAIICGRDKDSSKRIFDNLSKVYKLRSKIAHGDKYDLETIHGYIPFLINLASLYLFELLNHEIQDKKSLNDKLTEIGFGQGQLLSNNYERIVVDEELFNKVNEIEFK